MITEEMLYWIFRLDSLRSGFWAITLLGTIFVICATFLRSEFAEWNSKSLEEYHALCKKIIFNRNIVAVITVISALALIFLPSTKEMAAIKIIPVIYNSDFVQKELPKEGKELYDLAKVAVKHTLIK